LKKDAMSVASLPQARRCLQALLAQPQSDGSMGLPLPNVKRLFRRWNLELSETALGFSRLHELLGSDCFNDVCTLEARENTYYVLPGAATTSGSNSMAPTHKLTPAAINAAHSSAGGSEGGCPRSGSSGIQSTRAWAHNPSTKQQLKEETAPISLPPGLFAPAARKAPSQKGAWGAGCASRRSPLPSSGISSVSQPPTLSTASPPTVPPPPPTAPAPPQGVFHPTINLHSAMSPLISGSSLWSTTAGCGGGASSGWATARSSTTSTVDFQSHFPSVQQQELVETRPPPGLSPVALLPDPKSITGLSGHRSGAVSNEQSPGSGSTTCSSSFCTPRSSRSPLLIETSSTHLSSAMITMRERDDFLDETCCRDKTLPVKLVRPFTSVPNGRLELHSACFSLFGALSAEPSTVQPLVSSPDGYFAAKSVDDAPSLYLCMDPWRKSGEFLSFETTLPTSFDMGLTAAPERLLENT